MEESNRNWGLPLPPHFAPAIFSKLSIINLPTCRLVSKSWNHLVLHYAHSSPKIRPTFLFSTANLPSIFSIFSTAPTRFEYPKIHCFDIDGLSSVASSTLVGHDAETLLIFSCCNGLLFVEKGIFTDGEGIFNPMTNEFFQTPIFDEHHTFFYGFGFSPITKQYKLFRARDTCVLNVLRFGTNNNQWVSYYMPSPLNLKSHGVYMDGVLYWVGKEKEDEYVIYALDVETEIFRVIAILEVGPHPSYALVQPFNGTIYAIFFMPSQIEVWRMEKKDSSWVKDFILCGIYRDVYVYLVKALDGKIFLRIVNDLFCLDKFGDKIEKNNFPQVINNSLKAIKNAIKNFLQVIVQDIYYFDLSWRKKIKPLIPYDRLFRGNCVMESLHFGSLSNILAGDD